VIGHRGKTVKVKLGGFIKKEEKRHHPLSAVIICDSCYSGNVRCAI